MKKWLWLVCFILLLALVACSEGKNGEPELTSEEEKEDEVVEVEEEQTEETDEKEEEQVEETRQEKDEEKAVEEDSNTSPDASEPQNIEKKNGEKEKGTEQYLIDLAHDIFQAQKERDFDYLQSIISSGTKIDRDEAMFSFENVTYPHEQPFLTEDDLGEIEFRFIHETDEKSMIVGFGVINYETEFSYTVDFEFVQENDEWKMNDMDLNK